MPDDHFFENVLGAAIGLAVIDKVLDNSSGKKKKKKGIGLFG